MPRNHSLYLERRSEAAVRLIDLLFDKAGLSPEDIHDMADRIEDVEGNVKITLLVEDEDDGTTVSWKKTPITTMMRGWFAPYHGVAAAA